MPQENKECIALKPDDLKKVLDAINTANSVLKPYLIALTPAERKQLPKMSDNTVPFVQKTLEYAQTNSAFVPAYMDINELKIDFDAVETLAQVIKPLEQ